jgi:hypothetical protein
MSIMASKQTFFGALSMALSTIVSRLLAWGLANAGLVDKPIDQLIFYHTEDRVDTITQPATIVETEVDPK